MDAYLEDTATVSVIVGGIIGLITVVIVIYLVYAKVWRGNVSQSKKSRQRKKSKSGRDTDHVTSNNKTSHSKKQNEPLRFAHQKKGGLRAHPLTAADFKGHTDYVRSLAFEAGGKYLASVSDDRTLRVWLMKTVNDREHKYVRLNIEDHDYATNVIFSPDGSAVLVVTSNSNSVIVYKLLKSKGNLSLTTAAEFKLGNDTVDDNLISLDIATNGKYIMTCSKTLITLWTLKGDVLTSIETRQSPNNFATISKCSNFVGCCGFTTDVKIWEIILSKSGEFEKVTRAMELKGHSASVLSLCFSQDTKKAITISKDKTCRIWNIDVSYTLNEDPRVLTVIQLDSMPCNLAVSTDTLVLAIASNTSIYIYSCTNGELLETLTDVHNDTISDLLFEPNGSYIVSAGGNDRYIRLWYNGPGMRELVSDLREKLKQTTSDTVKERVNGQIADLEAKLSKIYNK